MDFLRRKHTRKCSRRAQYQWPKQAVGEIWRHLGGFSRKCTCIFWSSLFDELIYVLYCPAVFGGHSIAAPVKTDRAVRVQSTNQPKGPTTMCFHHRCGDLLSFLIYWLIYWFDPPVVKIAPRGWFPGRFKKWPNTAEQYSNFHDFSGSLFTM